MWHAWVSGDVLTGFWLRSPKARDNCEDLSVGGSITFRWSFGERDLCVELDSAGSG